MSPVSRWLITPDFARYFGVRILTMGGFQMLAVAVGWQLYDLTGSMLDLGLVGLVGIKVLAPGFYASQDMRTPVRIAVVVLVVTQLMNIALVPLFQHAGLALSIGLGALLNAGWLLVGLRRRGSWTPSPGWGRFLLQVVAATALLTVALMWAAGHFQWIALRENAVQRVALLGGLLVGSAALYFGALLAAGVNLRQFVTR